MCLTQPKTETSIISVSSPFSEAGFCTQKAISQYLLSFVHCRTLLIPPFLFFSSFFLLPFFSFHLFKFFFISIGTHSFGHGAAFR